MELAGLFGPADVLEWSKAPVLPHDTRRIRHIGLPQRMACPDRSLSRIRQRNKPNYNFEGGDRPKVNLLYPMN